MDLEEFRKNGKDTIDYMCDYFENIGKKKVMDNKAAVPGFLTEKLPDSAPEQPEPFANCLKDVEETIMPGVLHWHHPNFFAYFASGNSFPSILGEMLSAMFGTVGFIWVSSLILTF
jgi:tyrosine decarboxylase